MGVEISPQKMIKAAAPEGAPPWRIKTVEIIICRFPSFRYGLPFMPVSPKRFSFSGYLAGKKQIAKFYSRLPDKTRIIIIRHNLSS